MPNGKSPSSSRLVSPLRLFVCLLGVISGIELLIMFLLPLVLPGASGVVESFADAILLAALSSPFLWMLIVRPLRRVAMTEMARTEAVLEHVVDGVAVLDEQGGIEAFNPVAEGLFGYPAAEVAGRQMRYLVPEGGEDADAAADGRASHEVVGRRSSGTLFPLELSVSPVRVAGERKSICIMRDLTARKRAEQALVEQARELARSNAELEQFCSVASHDLQEPLRMVATQVQLLERRYRGRLDEEADRQIAFAVEGATRMKTLIDDLLALSRMGGGNALRAVQSAAALEQAMGDLRCEIEAQGAVIAYDPLPAVMADASQLGRLFTNLLGNALKFRGEQPPAIFVQAEQRGDDWLFSVRDNGIGIAPEDAEKIFTLFKRLHGRQRYPGNGIGLAECKKIVERHGGKIWVESEPGRGASFRFTLVAAGEGR